MPGMNAAEFLEAFRQLPELQDIPVIVVSSHSETEKRHRALLAGATDFLMVPLDTFEFEARTRNLLRLSQHQKILRSQSLSLRSELVETRHKSTQTRHRFISIIDCVPALVFAVNAAGDCVFANQYCFDLLGLAGRGGAARRPAPRRQGERRRGWRIGLGGQAPQRRNQPARPRWARADIPRHRQAGRWTR